MPHKKIETVCVDVIRALLKDEYYTRHALTELKFLFFFGHIDLFNRKSLWMSLLHLFEFTLYLISLFAVMHLVSSYFEEINFWSHLGEERAKSPQRHINLFHARIESIENENERFLKVELTTWSGSLCEANISCQNFVSKYAI